MERFKINFNLNCDNPEFFVSSQWQHNKRIPNLKYLIYRYILALYFVFVVILSIITAEGCNQLKFYLIYLTNWNVLLNGIQALLAAYLVTCYYRKSINFDNDLNKMSTTLKLFWAISTISVVVAVSLSCVYWPIIYSGRDRGINDALTHAVNAIILVIDLFIHAHPPRFSHVIYPILFGITYIIFSVIYTLSGGTDRDYVNYIYSVIDWNHKTFDAFLFSFAIIIFSSVMHVVLTILIKLRIFIYQKIRECQATENVTSNDNLGFDA